MLRNSLLVFFTTLLLSSGLWLAVSPQPVAAVCDPGLTGVDQSKCQACEGSGGQFADGACTTPGDEGRDLPGLIRAVINIIIFIVGAVAVLMLIIGGLRYVLSGGDAQGVEGAKNTILYAVIGVVVAFMAYAIVNFVIKNI